MPKRPKRTTQRNKADKLFSRYIRLRDRECRSCLTPLNLQCAHIFSRRYMSVRFDPANAMALCAGCHKKYTHNPIEWEDFCIKQMGVDDYQDLRRRAVVLTRLDYEEVLRDIEGRLARYE